MGELLSFLDTKQSTTKHSKNNHISTIAACAIFKRLINTAITNDSTAPVPSTLDSFKRTLYQNCIDFIDSGVERRAKIAEWGGRFIEDGSTILVHSYSRVVMSLLRKVCEDKVHFNVYVTESRPSKSG